MVSLVYNRINGWSWIISYYPYIWRIWIKFTIENNIIPNITS
jgi:hypothetical protein